MLFKKSFIPLSASMFLVLNSDLNSLADFMTAGIFFTLGVIERMKENDNWKREKEIIDEKEEHKRR